MKIGLDAQIPAKSQLLFLLLNRGSRFRCALPKNRAAKKGDTLILPNIEQRRDIKVFREDALVSFGVVVYEK